MIPPQFTGGWERISISTDGGEPYEDMTVWWLQSATKHADLRVALDPAASHAEPMAFAGTTYWAEPALTWVPDLELTRNEEPDTGVITWDGDDLLEAGATKVDGAEVTYVERWRRLPGAAGPQVALSRAGGRLVRSGDLALTIVDERPEGGTFNAVAWRLVEDAWTVSHRWPPEATAPPPPLDDPVSGVTPGVRLADGSLWAVDESSTDRPSEEAVAHG